MPLPEPMSLRTIGCYALFSLYVRVFHCTSEPAASVRRHFNLTRIDRQQVCNLRGVPFYAGGGFLDKKFVGPLVIRAGLKDTAPNEERVLG